MTTENPAPDGNAVYFDGRRNLKRRVTLRLAASLEIVEDGQVVDRWALDDLRRVDGPPERLRLSSVAALPLARLEIEDQMLQQAVVARATLLNVSHERQTWRVAGWSLAAAVSIVALVIYGVPLVADRLTPLVPRAVEKRLGDTVEKQVRYAFGGRLCTNADGQAAFAVLVGKLARAGGIDDKPEAQVVSSRVPNAFALPGGKIYLLNGLLQKAQNPDEIAGILAHEMGHVRHRDGLRHLIQAGGSSFLIGLLFGDVLGGSAVIFATRSMFNLAYSRDVERDADAFAITTMRALGRSPKSMGALLQRVTGSQAGRGSDILASHPLTEERLAAMAKADAPTSGADLLSAAQWQALKNICAVPRR